jgi:hypothetical protein
MVNAKDKNRYMKKGTVIDVRTPEEFISGACRRKHQHPVAAIVTKNQ